ncbi:MAG: hypothetical protein ACTSWP_01695 [Candidatus Freyarchaeota archaeon]
MGTVGLRSNRTKPTRKAERVPHGKGKEFRFACGVQQRLLTTASTPMAAAAAPPPRNIMFAAVAGKHRTA